MRKIMILLLTCTVCSGQLLFAQDEEPQYTWGAPSTNDNLNRKIDRLISYGDSGFLLLRKESKGAGVYDYFLEQYDAQLKLESTTKVNFDGGVMGNSFDIENIFLAKGNVYVLVSHWNKSDQRNKLSVKRLGEGGNMSDLKELEEISATKMGNRGVFKFSVSEDESKLLVLSEFPFVKKTNEKIRLSCYDIGSFDQVWSTEEELEYPSKRAANNHLAVNNKGQAYLFKRVWLRPEWKYSFYTFDSQGSMTLENLDLSGKEVIDHELTFNPENGFTMFGTYEVVSKGVSVTAEEFGDRTQGYIYLSYDANQKMVASEIKSWDTKLLSEVGKVKNPTPDDAKSFLNYGLKDIVFHQNGDPVILLEQYKMEKDGIEGTSPIQYQYTHKTGDVLALSMSGSSGEINWWQHFGKRQSVRTKLSGDDPYGSFVYLMKNDRLYILWNNTELSRSSIPPANWTEPDGTKYIKHKAFNEKTMHGTFMHVIEPDGSMAYAHRKYGLPLFNLHEGAVFEMSMNTNVFFEMNGNIVIMATMHNGGKRYRFGFVGL